MATVEYWVRCIKVQRPVPYDTSLWDSPKSSAKQVPDPILVSGPTTFVFTPDYVNSAPETNGFTLACDPQPPSTDIPSQPPTKASGASLIVGDNCKLSVDVNLNLRADFQMGGYVINGGKPTIRNRPQTAPPPRLRVIRLIVYTLIAMAAIYLFGHYWFKAF